MNAWNSYLWPKVIMTDNKAMTMPMLIANLITGYVTDSLSLQPDCLQLPHNICQLYILPTIHFQFPVTSYTFRIFKREIHRPLNILSEQFK